MIVFVFGLGIPHQKGIDMSIYKPPIVVDNKVIYKGKRYWIIELTGKDEINGFGSDFCQFIMYDKLYEAILATITKKTDGKWRASLMSHVELWYDFDHMDELIHSTPAYFESYAKACYG
jgi:hypothetical protein